MNLKAPHEAEDASTRLAENLCALLKKHHLNANQIANTLGIPMMTIRRLMSGETIDPRISTLKLIADHFGVSLNSLIEGSNQLIAESLKRTKPQFVPILDWDTAKKVTTINDLELNKWKDWLPVSVGEHLALGKNSFALESRPSMYQRFPQGTIFIIDPDVKPQDGDIILIKIKQNNELTLRELSIDPPEWQLQSIVPGSNTLKYTEINHNIVGVNLLTLFYNRRAYG